jgi:enoyl-CoA hydratase/carnithine racemase
VRAVVLTGSGGSFCAGADLKAAFVDDPDFADRLEERVDEYHAMIRAIAGAPKPVVAAVDGAAVGFGCDLALACDLRLASTSAYFQQKFVKIGLMPDGGGTFWMPRLVGTARAMELMMTGAAVPADRAEALGIVNRVVAPERLDAEALALATELAKGPPLALAQIKQAVLEGLGGTLDAALAREKAGQVRCLRSADAMEGVAAWMQRREPAFRGE